MHSMFEYCSNFNQPLNTWNVSNVITMQSMFCGASIFNQPIDNWNLSSMKNMSYMFFGAENFNHPLTNWNIVHVKDTKGIFMWTIAFHNSNNLHITTQKWLSDFREKKKVLKIKQINLMLK